MKSRRTDSPRGRPIPEVPLWFGAAPGGLCASEELAHNGLASGAANPEVPLGFVAALGGLRASEELAHNGLSSGRPIRKFRFGLWPHSAACALRRNSRTTERGVSRYLAHSVVRAAPFALFAQQANAFFAVVLSGNPLRTVLATH
jgi:hypothetical protein